MKQVVKEKIFSVLAYILCVALLLPVTGSAAYQVRAEEEPRTYAEVTLDSDYVEPNLGGVACISEMIPTDILEEFQGPVAVTLEYEATEGPWFDIIAMDEENWIPLVGKGNTIVYEGEGSITFVLSEEEIAKASVTGGVRFNLGNVYFKTAVLTVPTPEDYYAGDWNVGYTFSEEEISGFEEDVRLTMKYSTLSGYDWYAYNMVGIENWEHNTLVADDYVDSFIVDGDNNITIDPEKNMAYMTIKKETMDAISTAASGSALGIKTYGIIVEEASLEELEHSDYIGDYEFAYELDVADLKAIDGDVALNVTYRAVVDPNHTYNNFGIYRNVEAYDKEYFLKADDFVYVETYIDPDWHMIDAPVDANEMLLVLSAEAVAGLEVESLVFPSFGVIIDDVTISRYSNEPLDSVTVPLDDAYPEEIEGGGRLSAPISYETLKQFGGPVAVTLDYKVVDGTWFKPVAMDESYFEWLVPKGNITVDSEAGEGSITFVLDEKEIAKAAEVGQIQFSLIGVYFTQAVLREAEPDDYYAGDWNTGYSFTVEELEPFAENDVTFKIKYRPVSSEEYDWPVVQLTDMSNWTNLTTEDFADDTETDEWDNIAFSRDGVTKSITISAETVDRLIANGGDEWEGVALAFRVNGVILERVILKSNKNVFPMEVVEDGDNKVTNVIPAEALTQFEGPVAVTLNYEFEGEADWRGFNVMTAWWGGLPTSGNTTIGSEPGTLTFVLEEEALERIAEQEGLMFQLMGGVYFTKAVLSEAMPEDYYVGDWNSAYTFTLDTLADLEAGEATLTISYTTLSVGYDWPEIQLTDLSNWENLMTEDFADGTETNEWGNVSVEAGKTRVTLRLKEETIARLVENGGDDNGIALAIRVCGLLVKGASIEVIKEDKILLDDTYPEASEDGVVRSAIIPVEELEEFEGNIALTLTYDTTGEADWPWFFVNTAGGTPLTPKGMTFISEATGKITFVLETEDIEKALAEGGVQFHLGEVFFTDVVLRNACNEDYYVGDYNTAYSFYPDDMKNLTGDVVFTMKYDTLLDYRWPTFQLTVMKDDVWTDLGRDDYVDGSNVDDYECIYADPENAEITMVIKEEVMQNIIATESELGIRVVGVLVQEASLKSEKDDNPSELVGRTGTLAVEADDPTQPHILFADGVPADGQTHLLTYEIYDAEGNVAGIMEYRAGENTMDTYWFTVNGISGAAEPTFNPRSSFTPRIEYWVMNQYFRLNDAAGYAEYTYKIVGDEVLTEEISLPQNVCWDDTKTPGWITWDKVEGASGYAVYLQRDGGTYVAAFARENENYIRMTSHINESATYTVIIRVLGGKTTVDNETGMVAKWDYVKPETAVAPPTKMWWSSMPGSDIPTIIHWNPVVGAEGYMVTLDAYDANKPMTLENLKLSVGYILYNTDEAGLCTEANFSGTITEENRKAAAEGTTYTYIFKLQSLSGNIELLANSTTEDAVATDEYRTLDSIQNEIKDEISNNGIDAAINERGKQEFGDAMKRNKDIRDAVASKEEEHISRNGITVSKASVDETLGIDANSITMVGAGMNVESGIVGLVMKPAENELDMHEELYFNPVQVDISLVNGEESIRELDVPMVIIMDAPADIAPERLVIVHEHEGETELIYPEYNAEDNTITFPVTGFSTFAFAGITLYSENGKEVTNPGGSEPNPTPDPEPEHEHVWATSWTNNKTYHWHECIGEGDCDVTQNSAKNGYARHTYSNSKDKYCNDCNYKRNVSSGGGGGSSSGGGSGSSTTPVVTPTPVPTVTPTVTPSATVTPTKAPVAAPEGTYNPETSWTAPEVYAEESKKYDIFIGTSAKDASLGRTVKKGETVDLNFYGVKNWSKDAYTYQWTTSDTSIATVNSSGVVNMVDDGIAIIKLELINKATGEVMKVAPIEVGVPAASYEVKVGTSAKDADLRRGLEIGKTVDLNFYGVKGWKKDAFTYEWYSTDESVATVGPNGEVTAVAAGKAIIRLRLKDIRTGEYLVVAPVVVVVPEK